MNLLDVLSAKQGKKAWPLNQTDAGMVGERRKTNPHLPTYREMRKERDLPTVWEEHPLPLGGQGAILPPPSTCLEATALVHLTLLLHTAKKQRAKCSFSHRPPCLNPTSGVLAAKYNLLGLESVGPKKLMLQ